MHTLPIARPLTGGSCNYEKCQCVRFPRTVLEGYLPIKAISVSTTACFAERSLWLVFGRIPAFPRSQGSSERGKEGNTAAFLKKATYCVLVLHMKPALSQAAANEVLVTD